LKEARFIYWKIETPQASWNLIPDTPEARRKAIEQGAMFFTWASLSAPYNEGNGHPEPYRWGDLPLDFDSPNNIQQALEDLRTLCFIHLPEFYDIDPYDLQYFLSGGKGFHAIIPARLLNAEDGDPRLPLIFKDIVGRWKEALHLTSLDMSLYNMKRGKMFRIPNIRRLNGKYKVPISLDEIIRTEAQDLIEFGNAPRNLENY
jgi:hypothetical protein